MKGLPFINILRFTIKAFFIGLLVGMILCIGMLSFVSYQDFTYHLMAFYGKIDKLEEFRLQYYTLKTHQVLPYFFYFAFILSLGFVFYLSKVSDKLILFFAYFKNSFISFFEKLKVVYLTFSKIEKITFFVLLGFIFLVKVYFLQRFYFHIDEITSYLFFVNRGVFVTMSYYPNPNNHIFYLLLVSLFKPLISNPFYLMKVPSILVSMLSSAFLFLFLKKYFGFGLSVLGVLIFSFSAPILYYSVFGRGYGLMTFFVIMNGYLVMEALFNKETKFSWLLYGLFSVLGFYTMIIYLYPLLSFAFVLIVNGLYQRDFNFIKKTIIVHFVITFIVLLLYTPVFIVSGLSSLTANSWIKKLGFGETVYQLPSYIENAFQYLINYDAYAFIIGVFVLFSALILLLLKKNWTWLLLLSTFYVVPILMVLVQQIVPYNRIWTYLSFALVVSLLFIIQQMLSYVRNAKIRISIIAALGIFTCVVSCKEFYYLSSKDGNFIYEEVDRISAYVAKEGNGEVFTNDNVYNLYLRYYGVRNENNLVPDMLVDENDAYVYLLLSPDLVSPSGLDLNDYTLVEKNAYIEVYKRKG